MLNVTDLAEYSFCPRKLYLKKVLKVKEPKRKCITVGSIKHYAYCLLYKNQINTVTSIKKETTREDARKIFAELFYTSLARAIKYSGEDIEKLDLDPFELFQSIWPSFVEEATEMADSVYGAATSKRLYGEELWESITAKIVPEQRLFSERLGLAGRADKLEIENGTIKVCELKSGKPPPLGVWENQKIQVGAYIMLAKESIGKTDNCGIVEYIDTKEKRVVALDNELETEILETIKKIREMCARKAIPPKLNEKLKCESCSLKEECSSI